MAITVYRVEGNPGSFSTVGPDADFYSAVIAGRGGQNYGLYENQSDWIIQTWRFWGITQYFDSNGFGPVYAAGAPSSSNEYRVASNGWQEVEYDISIDTVFSSDDLEEALEYVNRYGFNYNLDNFYVKNSIVAEFRTTEVGTLGNVAEVWWEGRQYSRVGYFFSYFDDRNLSQNPTKMFTEQRDVVDFNNIRTSREQWRGSLYNALNGDDTILLPNSTRLTDELEFSTNASRRFDAGDGADIIMGRLLDDFVNGGRGNDVLMVSAGNDNLRGGEGNDVFDFRAAEEFLVNGTRQRLVGGPNEEFDLDVLQLSGSAYGYSITLNFSSTWVGTTADVALLEPTYTLVTSLIQKVKFSSIFEGAPTLRDPDEVLERMVDLANGVYGETTVPFVAQSWHPVSALELGIKPSDYLGVTSSGEVTRGYSFSDGVYEMKSPSRVFATNDAVAMVMTGVEPDAGRVLSVTFKGSDKILEDPIDWGYDISRFLGLDGNLGSYFRRYAPLVNGLKEYISDNSQEIDKIIVAGHSLGGGMVQYFINNLVNAGVVSAEKIEGYTFASVGGARATLTAPEPHMINFVPMGDVTQVLNPGSGQRAGTIITVDGPSSRSFSLGASHSIENIERDIGELAALANGDRPFSTGALATAIRDGSLYKGPDLTIGLGLSAADSIFAAPAYRYTMAGGGNDSLMVWRTFAGSEGRDIDGGSGSDILSLGFGRSECIITPLRNGGVGISLAEDGKLICRVFDIELLRFTNGDYQTDGTRLPLERLMRDAITGDYHMEASAPRARSGSGDMRIVGTDQADVLFLGAGSKEVRMGSGNDFVAPGEAAYKSTDPLNLDGGSGRDIMRGARGDDTYRIDNLRDQIVDPAGHDLVISSVSHRLGGQFEDLQLTRNASSGFGNEKANEITGNRRANLLDGAGGGDVISGGAGDDRIAGALGADVMSGGAGADTFVYYAPDWSPLRSGRDRITDFSAGDGDRIDLSPIDADDATAGDQTLAFLGSGQFSQQAGEIRVIDRTRVTLLQGDMDGNGSADFEIVFSGHVVLGSAEIIL